jgi:hypothetical protein
MFKKRNSRWRSFDRVEDVSLGEKLRSLDVLCFSSQYYFIISVGSFGNVLMLLAIGVLVRIMHNPFGDKLSVPIIGMVILILWVSFFTYLHIL